MSYQLELQTREKNWWQRKWGWWYHHLDGDGATKTWQAGPWYCNVMRIIDVRQWFCECTYAQPYGRAISADCERHD